VNYSHFKAVGWTLFTGRTFLRSWGSSDRFSRFARFAFTSALFCFRLIEHVSKWADMSRTMGRGTRSAVNNAWSVQISIRMVRWSKTRREVRRSLKCNNCDLLVPRGPIIIWQLDLPRVSGDQLRAATWTNSKMTAGSATCIRGPVTGCHVDQSENATCLQGPVKTCHVDQLEHGVRGGVLRPVKNERKSYWSAFSMIWQCADLMG